jgi:hypothetical protein
MDTLFLDGSLGPHSNVVKGLFIIVTHACTLFAKMNLAAAANILASPVA